MIEPHVYVIHLRHRTDRKKQFMEAWDAAGLPTHHLHWHSAVLGSSLPPATLAAFRTVAKTRKARAGRVGCYCSHVAAIKKAVRANHFPLLILEDDAMPVAIQDRVSLGALFASAPPASLLYFGALPVKDRKRIKNYCGSAGWLRPTEGTQLYGGHAYGFTTREAAVEVLEFLEANKMTLDSALVRWTKAHRNRVAVYCPFQFVQAEGFSDIEGVRRAER
jgi:hypothetical protein